MYEKLSNIFNIIIRGISETALVYVPSIILIYFFAGIDSYTLINKIVFFNMMNYLSSYALSFYVIKRNKLNYRNKSILILFAVVLSLISAYITSKNILIFVFIAYLVVWYIGMVLVYNCGHEKFNTIK